jgi:hypothetical protein
MNLNLDSLITVPNPRNIPKYSSITNEKFLVLLNPIVLMVQTKNEIMKHNQILMSKILNISN